MPVSLQTCKYYVYIIMLTKIIDYIKKLCLCMFNIIYYNFINVELMIMVFLLVQNTSSMNGKHAFSIGLPHALRCSV